MQIWALCGRHRFGSFVGDKVGLANFFLGQSIGLDENNTFQLIFILASKL